MRWCFVLMISTFAVSACSSPSSSTPIDASGSWQRMGCEHVSTGCAMTMVINQSGASLSGSFTWDGTSGGYLSGTVAGQAVSANLVPRESPTCHLSITGIATGDRWSGSMTFQCDGPNVIVNPAMSTVTFARAAATP